MIGGQILWKINVAIGFQICNFQTETVQTNLEINSIWTRVHRRLLSSNCSDKTTVLYIQAYEVSMRNEHAFDD